MMFFSLSCQLSLALSLFCSSTFVSVFRLFFSLLDVFSLLFFHFFSPPLTFSSRLL